MAKKAEKSIYRDGATNVLSKMYEKSNDIAGNHSGLNRGIAAGTAASLLSLGIDRINNGKVPEENDGIPYNDEELDHLRELGVEMDESKSSHFVDKLMERLLKHAIPTDTPDKKILEKRVTDPDRASKPNLSIRIIASNFKRLSTKMTAFFQIQYGLIHIVSWRNPTKTLSCLVLYTSICLWPHLVLAYPLIFLLFGVMIPSYIYRHPMGTSELIKVKKRGQSLLEFFNHSNDTSVITDLLGDEYNHDSDTESLSPRSSDFSTLFTQHPISSSATATDVIEENDQIKKKDKTRHVRSQMTLLVNMRDLQNLTTDVLNGINAGERFWYETAGFKDERLTTFIFYGIITATSIVLVLGRFIPWRLIFIQSGWAGLIFCHPHSKKYILSIKKSRAAQQVSEKKKSDEEAGRFERHDIIIDDSAEIRMVEVYELENKSLLTNKWKFNCYTNNMFDLKSHVRASNKKPHGADHLGKILPPPDWKFDIGYANKWVIDKSPHRFLHERTINNPCLTVPDGEKEGWIYDNMKDIDNQDIVYEFRRRRLSRECFRYSRPPKSPVLT